VDGKANTELVAFVARLAEVPRRAVRLVRGETGRRKSLEIEGGAEVAARIAGKVTPAS